MIPRACPAKNRYANLIPVLLQRKSTSHDAFTFNLRNRWLASDVLDRHAVNGYDARAWGTSGVLQWSRPLVLVSHRKQMSQQRDIAGEIRRFLGDDLSRLERRYDERFTDRLSYDGQSVLEHRQDDLDAELREWTTANHLGDKFAHAIRSQPYENAQRVFRDLRQMVDGWEGSRQRAGPLAQYSTTYELDWLMALFAIRGIFELQLTNLWIFETLRLFWPIDLVAQWLHTLFPEEFFPISSELFWRTDRFRRYCEGFGVEVEWPSIEDPPVAAYLQVDEAIRLWADEYDMDSWQLWATFEHLAPRLFTDDVGSVPGDRRVWVAMSSKDSFDGLDDQNEDIQTWTANRDIRCGDVVLMYCMTPRKAITHKFRALCDAYDNPFDDSWTTDRVWTELGEKEVLPSLTLDEMREDHVLSTWGVVRSNFQGARKSSVPQAIWKRIEELMDAKRQDPDWAQRAVVSATRSGQGVLAGVSAPMAGQTERELEREFEERAVKPLLQRLGLNLSTRVTQQVAIRMYVGSRRVTNRADFVVFGDDDRQAPIAVIESKRSINKEDQLRAARQQAESYAGYLRVSTFVVIAPQGVWAYGLRFPGQSEQVLNCSLEEAARDPHCPKLTRLLGLE